MTSRSSERPSALTAGLAACLLSAIWLACGPTVRRAGDGEPSAQTEQAGTLTRAATTPEMPLPIGGVVSVFGDRPTQWDVLDYEGERIGDLSLRYPPVAGRGGDLTEWDFRVGEVAGSVRPKIRGREDQWEVRVGDDVATVRPVFPRQFDQWAVASGDARVVYAVRDFALLEYWSTRGPGGPGTVEMYTRLEGDPREWVFHHEITAPVSPATQLALLWLPVYMRLAASR